MRSTIPDEWICLMTRCPRCDYRLCGLASPIVCPECGLELGKDPVVFRARGAPWIVLGCASLAVGVSFVIVGVWRGAKPIELAWVASFLILAGGSAARWYSGTRRFLIVSSDAIRIVSPNRETLTVPLSIVVGACISPVDGAVQILGIGDKALGRFCLGSARLANATANEIRSRTRRGGSSIA